MAINPNLETISSGYNISKINSNFQAIGTALQDAVSRSGQTPNQMDADFDMNGNDILNVDNIDVNTLTIDGVPVVVNGGVSVDPDSLVPVGGTDGQVLTKQSATDYDTAWEDIPAGIPAGGTDGQVLTKQSGTDFDADWETIPASIPSVATRTALKALDTTTTTTAILTEAGRQGLFLWTTGDFSTLIAADTLEGIYVKADAIASTAGSWVRAFEGPIDVRWFGAKNDNSADAYPGIQAAIDLVEVIGAAITEGPLGSVWGPPGWYRCDNSVVLEKAIVFRLEGEIYYTPTTGSAVIVSAAATSQHTFYDIDIEGLRAVNGNGSIPTSINAAGCSGIHIRRMQFSRVRVGQIIGFTKYGAWLNSSNSVFVGQHIQDNDLSLDQLAYCGAGLYAESISAADGACQVNRINIQNSFSNFRDVELGEAGDVNTNHNIVSIAALDAPGAGGSELRVFGSYNIITLGFVDTGGIVSFESGSLSNIIQIGRNDNNVTYSDAGTDNVAIFSNGVRKGRERFKTTATGAEPLALESTDAGATYAQLLELYRNSASPADNDGGVGILAYFNDGAANKTEGGRIRTDMPTVADGNENLRWLFDTIVGGTIANRMILWQGLILGSPTSGDLGTGTLNVAGSVAVNGVKYSPPGAPVTKTADFTVAATEQWLLNNKGSACVVTLPSAASSIGRELKFTNIGGAFALTSASSNVVPKAGGAAGTAILAATDGAWATLVSDGTNWIIMQAGT